MEYCLAVNPRAYTSIDHLKEWLLETCVANAQKEGYQIVGEPQLYIDETPDEHGRAYLECSVEIQESGTPSKLME